MKKRNLIFAFLMLLNSIVFSQILTPVKWTFSSSKTSDSTANLYFKASIDPNWHVYSQFIEGEGPVPTTFTFDKSKDYSL